MDLGEIAWGGMDWIDLAQDRGYWRACKHSNQPSGSRVVHSVMWSWTEYTVHTKSD
jgi:hypothetical protein